MRGPTHHILGVIAAIVATASTAYAQEVPMLGGVVCGSAGKPLRGATIRILGTSPARGAISKQDGTFLICDVNEGEYDIRISAVGFRDTTIRYFIDSGRPTLLPAIMIVPKSKEELGQTTNCNPIGPSERMGTTRSIIFDSWGRVGRSDR